MILLSHDTAALDVSLQVWKKLCRKAWENEYGYLQTDRIAKTVGSKYTIANCNKNN